jgi:hypothetical protein
MILAGVVLFGVALSADARLREAWPSANLAEKADLIDIARIVSTQDAKNSEPPPAGRCQDRLVGVDFRQAEEKVAALETEYCSIGKTPAHAIGGLRRYSFHMYIPEVVMAEPPPPGIRVDIGVVEHLPNGKSKGTILVRNVLLLRFDAVIHRRVPRYAVSVAVTDEQFANLPGPGFDGDFRLIQSAP